MPPCPHTINSDSQHVQSASERKHLQSSMLCSDSQGKHCHPTGHSLFRTCKVPKSFHQANTTLTTLSSKLLSVTAKRMYAFRTFNTGRTYPHAINSDSQHVQSASERKHLQSSMLCSDSQGKHCHPTGHSLFRTCKVPKSFHQANTTLTTLSSKLLSVTAKRMYAFWMINTYQYHAAMPPYPHAINSDSQHVQSASERKHLQSSLLFSDSQGKHCHPTGHSLFRTCKVPKSFHQANTTLTTLASKLLSVTAKRMYAFWMINTYQYHAAMPPCPHTINSDSQHVQSASERKHLQSSMLCSDSQGKHCHPSGHSLFRTCKVPKSFHQANTTHTTLASKLLSVTAKRMYAFWTINTGRPYPHAINSDSQHVQSASERKHLQSSMLCSDSQGKHCHPTGHSLFRTCKVPKSFHQANTTLTTLSSKLLSVTAKRMYAFRTFNTGRPYPHAIISDSQHVQSASERKHLQSSMLCSDSQGKHCHPTGHSLFRTCKVPKSFHQANTTHATLASKLLSVTAKRMYAFWMINTYQYHAAMPPYPHAINSDSQHVQSASERKHLQSSMLCSDSQGKHCHPTGHSLFRTCKVPKSFHQANTTHTTLSSKLLSVTAKRMYAFWTINTMPPCPHAINSDSQHVQSASERKHLQSSMLCSDSQGKHCHPTGHSLFRTCKVPKSFHQANTTHTTLASKLLSVTAKRMYAFWTINTMPPYPHAINSDSQHVQSASERKHLQSSMLCSDSQGKHCHPTGHSLFRTCKVPKSFHQANTTLTTLSSKLLSVTAKRMYAFWMINTYHAAMPPCPHTINSDSQHVQSASERKHLQSSLLFSDSQGKHCHPTGHSLFRTCKVPKSFHQANTTLTTLASKLLSVTAKRMYAFWMINTMPPCRHAPMPSFLILNMSNQQANGNISNLQCCAQTAKGNIVILLDTLCFEHAKYLSPFIKRTERTV